MSGWFQTHPKRKNEKWRESRGKMSGAVMWPEWETEMGKIKKNVSIWVAKVRKKVRDRKKGKQLWVHVISLHLKENTSMIFEREHFLFSSFFRHHFCEKTWSSEWKLPEDTYYSLLTEHRTEYFQVLHKQECNSQYFVELTPLWTSSSKQTLKTVLKTYKNIARHSFMSNTPFPLLCPTGHLTQAL